ncbi:hypothetical protein LY76DRAFT_252994 [Colletotrichum caudatum]|nr:hypothetical protein LY76DRAFT_252994 [Colletotrichum caudatum]
MPFPCLTMYTLSLVTCFLLPAAACLLACLSACIFFCIKGGALRRSAIYLPPVSLSRLLLCAFHLWSGEVLAIVPGSLSLCLASYLLGLTIPSLLLRASCTWR